MNLNWIQVNQFIKNTLIYIFNNYLYRKPADSINLLHMFLPQKPQNSAKRKDKIIHFVKGVSIGTAPRLPDANHLGSKTHSYSPPSKHQSSFSKHSSKPVTNARRPGPHEAITAHKGLKLGHQKQNYEVMQNYSQGSPTTSSNLLNHQIAKTKSFQSLKALDITAVKTHSPIKVLDSYVDQSSKSITANKQNSSNKSNQHVAKKFLAILPQYAPSKLNLNNKLLYQQKGLESKQTKKDVSVETEPKKQFRNQEQQLYYVPRQQNEMGPEELAINALKNSSDRFVLNDTVTQPWLSSNHGSQNSNRSVASSSFQNSKTNRQRHHNETNRESFQKPQNNEQLRNSLSKSKRKSSRQNASVNYYKIMSEESVNSKEDTVDNNQQEVVVDNQKEPIEVSVQNNGFEAQKDAVNLDPQIFGAVSGQENCVNQNTENQDHSGGQQYKDDVNQNTQLFQNPYNTSSNLLKFQKSGLRNGTISRIDAYSDQMVAINKKDGSKSQQEQTASSKTLKRQAGTLKLESEVTDYNQLSQLNFHLDYQMKHSHNSLKVSSQNNQQHIQGSRLDNSCTDLQHLFDQEERDEAIKRSSGGSEKKRSGFFQSRNLSIKQRTHPKNKEQIPLHRFTIDSQTFQKNYKSQISRKSLPQSVYQGAHSQGCKGHHDGNFAIRNQSYKKNFTKFDCKLCYSDIFHEYHEQEAQREMAKALREYTLAEEGQKHYSTMKLQNINTHVASSALTVVSEQFSRLSQNHTERSDAIFKLRPKAHSQVTISETVKVENQEQNHYVKNDKIPLNIMIQAMNKSNTLIDSNDLVHNHQNINMDTLSFLQKAKVSTDELEVKDLEGQNQRALDDRAKSQKKAQSIHNMPTPRNYKELKSQLLERIRHQNQDPHQIHQLRLHNSLTLLPPPPASLPEPATKSTTTFQQMHRRSNQELEWNPYSNEALTVPQESAASISQNQSFPPKRIKSKKGSPHDTLKQNTEKHNFQYGNISIIVTTGSAQDRNSQDPLVVRRRSSQFEKDDQIEPSPLQFPVQNRNFSISLSKTVEDSFENGGDGRTQRALAEQDAYGQETNSNKNKFTQPNQMTTESPTRFKQQTNKNNQNYQNKNFKKHQDNQNCSKFQQNVDSNSSQQPNLIGENNYSKKTRNSKLSEKNMGKEFTSKNFDNQLQFVLSSSLPSGKQNDPKSSGTRQTFLLIPDMQTGINHKESFGQNQGQYELKESTSINSFSSLERQRTSQEMHNRNDSLSPFIIQNQHDFDSSNNFQLTHQIPQLLVTSSKNKSSTIPSKEYMGKQSQPEGTGLEEGLIRTRSSNNCSQDVKNNDINNSVSLHQISETDTTPRKINKTEMRHGDALVPVNLKNIGHQVPHPKNSSSLHTLEPSSLSLPAINSTTKNINFRDESGKNNNQTKYKQHLYQIQQQNTRSIKRNASTNTASTSMNQYLWRMQRLRSLQGLSRNSSQQNKTTGINIYGTQQPAKALDPLPPMENLQIRQKVLKNWLQKDDIGSEEKAQGGRQFTQSQLLNTVSQLDQNPKHKKMSLFQPHILNPQLEVENGQSQIQKLQQYNKQKLKSLKSLAAKQQFLKRQKEQIQFDKMGPGHGRNSVMLETAQDCYNSISPKTSTTAFNNIKNKTVRQFPMKSKPSPSTTTAHLSTDQQPLTALNYAKLLYVTNSQFQVDKSTQNSCVESLRNGV